MRPAISLIVGVRDGAGVLPRALESLRAQTLQDWECVVVDDGDDDRILQVVRLFGDARVRLVRQASAGLTAALIRGLEEARAPIIARLDADDEAVPERLQRQLEFLGARPEVVAVGTGVEVVSESGLVLSRHSYAPGHDGLVRQLHALLTPLPHSTLMVRRDALEAVGGYRRRFLKAQDYDLLLRLSEFGRLSSLPEALVRLHASRGSISMNSEGGEQFEYGVLAYTSAVVRSCSGPDPLEGPKADAFAKSFRSWYRSSRYPSLFLSRRQRRTARIAWGENRPALAAAALARATLADPSWALSRVGLGGDIAADARNWAENWASGAR